MVSRFTPQARAVMDALAGYEPTSISGMEAAQDAETLAQVAKVCQAAALRAAARATECRAHRGSAGEWVGQLTGTSAGAARRQLETAASVTSSPAVQDALTQGRISVEQAAIVLDGAAADPSAVDALVRTAEERGLAGVRDAARKLRLERQDPRALHERQRRLTELAHWVDDDGMVAGRFRLPPEIGTPIVTRLERHADRLYRAAPKDDRHGKPHGAFLADALVAALAGTGARGRGRTDLVLVVDYERWTGASDQGRCHVPGVGPVPVEVARQLATDAFVKGVVVDGTKVSTVRHFGRNIPAEVRTVLDLGPPPDLDGRCCRNCGRRMGLETDHIRPWCSGGPTTADNLEDLCRPCHREKTERDRVAGLMSSAAGSRSP